MTTRLRGDRPDDIAFAADLLRSGGLVAFPTETVYGLGAHGLDERAVRRIFEVKQRPPDNPVILHVASLERALPLWTLTTWMRERAEACANAFWPGPLTLVLPAARDVPLIVSAGLGSVGVRVPRHDVALALLRRADLPVAAPSANLSGRPSPTSAAHVLRTLGDGVDAVLDGGETHVGLESTVLDLSRPTPLLLRPGMIDRASLASVLGDIDSLDASADHDAASPGLRHRHYAPAFDDISLLDPSAVDAGSLTRAWSSDAALLLLEDTARRLEAEHGPRSAPLERLPRAPDAYARGFYAALYRLEERGASRLLVEDVPHDDSWAAIRDRAHRATRAR